MDNLLCFFIEWMLIIWITRPFHPFFSFFSHKSFFFLNHKEFFFFLQSVFFFSFSPPLLFWKDVKIGDLRPDSKGVNLVAKVISVEVVHQRERPDGSRVVIAEAVIADETGCITFTLRNGKWEKNEEFYQEKGKRNKWERNDISFIFIVFFWLFDVLFQTTPALWNLGGIL